MRYTTKSYLANSNLHEIGYADAWRYFHCGIYSLMTGCSFEFSSIVSFTPSFWSMSVESKRQYLYRWFICWLNEPRMVTEVRSRRILGIESRTLPEWLKRLKHRLHWNGFSPVCNRRCSARWCLCLNAFLQISQMNGRTPAYERESLSCTSPLVCVVVSHLNAHTYGVPMNFACWTSSRIYHTCRCHRAANLWSIASSPWTNHRSIED